MIWRRFLTVAGMSIAAGACGSEPTQPNQLQAAPLKVLASPSLAYRSKVVLGFERVFDLDGNVVEERIINSGDAPADAARLAARGVPSAAGVIYGRGSGERSDNGETVRYSYVFEQPQKHGEPEPGKETYPDIPERPAPVLEESLLPQLREAGDATVRVWIRLRQKPLTSISEGSGYGYLSVQEAAASEEARKDRISARKYEIDSLQRDTRSLVQSLGGRVLESFWLVNEMLLELPASKVVVLAASSEAERVYAHTDAEDVPLEDWDGVEMRAGGGAGYFGAGYINLGFSGAASSTPIKIAIIDDGFNESHPGFKNGSSGSCPNDASSDCRVNGRFDCTNNPCTSGGTGSNASHGTEVAGLAAGDLMDAQDSSVTNSTEQRKRSGLAEEAHIFLIRANSPLSTKRAVQKAVDLGVKVMNRSAETGDSSCDGKVAEDVHLTINAASEAGILYVNAAGNSGGGGCTVKGYAEAINAFVVGGVSNSSGQCAGASNSYQTCPIYSASSQGGITIKVNGTNRIASAVDAMGIACPNFFFNTSNGYLQATTKCGTSYAAPQVAAGAVLIRDYMHAQHGASSLDVPGTHFAMVLGMTDRADSDTTYKQNRFHERWGGGRFAMKRLDSGASGTWGWEIYDYTMAKNDVILHEIQGSGTEPSNIVTAKAYSVWNDSDPENASDIDISLRTNNCLSPTTTLSSDTSFDLKAMVYKGAEAANQKLCVRISALHIPGSQTRKVALYTWYSDATTLQ